MKEREQHVSDDLLRLIIWTESIKPATIQKMIVAVILLDLLRTGLMILHTYAQVKGLGP